MMNLMSLLLGLAPALQGQDVPQSSLFFPPKASNFAAESDWLYNFIFWVSLVAFVLTIGAAAYLTWRYRQSREPEPQPSPHHSLKLEVIWSVIPSIFLVIFFWKGFELFVDLRKVPPGAYQIQVTGQKWSWSFRYPNGATSGELHVPKGEPVELLITSKDVLHSVFIPAFRVKQDAVPGRYTRLWFEATMATAEGQPFPMYCTEYCGTNHSGMGATVTVHETRESFEAKLKELADPYSDGASLAENGAIAYKQRGCATCHSNDGTELVGPSFEGLFGSERQFEDGSSAVADEDYLLRSIVNPQAQVVQGYPPSMVANGGQDLNDEEREYLVAYIKSLGN